MHFKIPSYIFIAKALNASLSLIFQQLREAKLLLKYSVNLDHHCVCGFLLLEARYVLIPKALEDSDTGQEGVVVLPFCNSSHEWEEGNSIYGKSPTALLYFSRQAQVSR